MSPLKSFADHTDESVRPLIHVAAAGLLAAAGGLHLAALPEHLQVSTVAGAFFAVTAAAQLLGAVVVATRPSSRTIAAVVAGNVAVLIMWAMSRTTGLPTGGELRVREPLGLLDGLATAAEILVVLTGLAAIVRRSASASRRPGGKRLAFGLALAWGISGGAGLALADDGHHHGGGHSHSGIVSVNHGHNEPVGQYVHDAPPVGTGSDASSDTGPSPIAATCPAGHDCTDHPH
ncbi:MAG: hypothetical protein AB1679_04695 [Actinomycetota bacterium]|jgi:hypothetical protein